MGASLSVTSRGARAHWALLPETETLFQRGVRKRSSTPSSVSKSV